MRLRDLERAINEAASAQLRWYLTFAGRRPDDQDLERLWALQTQLAHLFGEKRRLLAERTVDRPKLVPVAWLLGRPWVAPPDPQLRQGDGTERLRQLRPVVETKGREVNGGERERMDGNSRK